MKIKDLYYEKRASFALDRKIEQNRDKAVFSLEVFPPKRDADIHVIFKALDEMKELSPDFISVTYGAGGGTSKETIKIASYIRNILGIPALAHLTCAGLDFELLQAFIADLKDKQIANVLALRGDQRQLDSTALSYAAPRICGDFCIQ